MNIRTPQKSPLKCKIENVKNEIKSDNETETIHMNLDDNNFFTPSKLNNDLFDTSLLDENEIVKMVHNTDNILDFDSIQLPNNSTILNYSSSFDENFNNENSMKISPVDPLSLDNENIIESKEIFVNRSRPRKKINYNDCYTESDEDSSLSEKESEQDNYHDNDKEEDEEEAEELLNKLFKAREKNLEKEILSSETIERLNNLVIRLKHVVPPQHKVENSAGSRTLSIKECKEFDKYSKRIKTKFSVKEDVIIKKNWKEFCKIHDWDENDVQPFLLLKHQGKIYISSYLERKKFVQFLAKGLPYRTLFSVYKRFRYLFSNRNLKGRFTPEVDKKIMIFMNCPKTDKNKKITQLSKILSRTHESIFRRFKHLLKLKNDIKSGNKKKFQQKVEWTLELTECFLENLMKFTLSKNIKELKNQKIPQVIWNELKKKMRIEVSALKNFWFRKLHVQLFSTDPIYLTNIKVKLIEILHSSDITNVKEIDWNEMLNYFDGLTINFLCDITYRMLKQTKKELESSNFVECVNYLYEIKIPQLKNNFKDKCLPRLCYKKKKLTIFDDIEEIESNNNELSKDDSRRSLKNFKEKKINYPKNKNLNWTLLLREKFLKMLLKLMIINDIEELKDALIPAIIWEKMSKNFHVHHKKLENLWYNEMHMQLYSPNPIYLNDLKITLIKLIHGKNIKNKKEINWNEIVTSFNGYTTNFLSQVFNDLVDAAVEEIETSNFSDVMKYLYETTLMKIIEEPNDKFLPRIIFENEKIQVIDENLENNEAYTREEYYKNEITDKSEIDLSMREDFLKVLLHLNLDTRIEKLKDAVIPMVVWEEMENQLKIDKNILQDLWYNELHLQFFSPSFIYLNDIKINLIELIYKRNLTDEKKINWNEICSHFAGMTIVFLSEIFHELVNFASEEIKSSNFSDIMRYLYEIMLLKLKEGKFDKFLPRIKFENDTIKVIDENFKNNVICKNETNIETTIANKSEIDLTARENILKTLIQLTVNTKIEDLKDAVIPTVVWKEMENQLKIDKNILQDLWFTELYLQLFSPNPIYLNDIKMSLIELICKRQITDENKINWNEISSHFNGMTTIFLSKVFHDLVDTITKIIDSKKFCDILDYLQEITFDELKNVAFDQQLPRIIFKNERIIILTEEMKNVLN